MKLTTKALLILVFFLFTACSQGEKEEVVSSYPSGKNKETAVFSGKEPNRARIKVFEYYETGEKKKEYSHQDNLFHGPFTYWYKNGKKLCDGLIENKAINLGMVTGKETYYWPNGVKMLEAETSGGKIKPGTTPIYRDETRKEYTDKERPKELIVKSKGLLERWERGEI